MIESRAGDGKRLVSMLAFFGVSAIPVIFGLGAVRDAAALFPLADSAHPYFLPDHGLLLYVWSPLAVVSACILMLGPGLCLALTSPASRSVERWILNGFALSVITLAVITPAAEALTGAAIRGGRFVALLIACTGAAWTVTLSRARRGVPLVWPVTGRRAVATVAMMIAVPAAMLAVMTPKFYWDNFNGDGAHAFEAARLLVTQAVPFFSPAAAGTASFPGVTSMLFTWPASWFIRLFGPFEASIRFSLLLYLPLLAAGIVAVAEHDRPSPLPGAARTLIWLPLTVYVVAMGYSATYNPYSADLALPATQDTLQVICLLGVVLAFLRSERAWLALWVAFCYTASPNGAMLIGLWCIAAWLVWRPRPNAEVRFTAGALVACAVLGALSPYLLKALHWPVPGQEYALRNFLTRFAFLQWWDWRRVMFAVLPSGIIPFVAVAHWKSQDRISRSLTLVTAVYFCFFYVQAYTVLHYFVPAMLLPIVVFWRSPLTMTVARRGVVTAATLACGLVALAVSLPADASPHTVARRIGATIDALDDGYDAAGAVAIGRSEVLDQLFAYDWDPAVPDRAYGGSPLVWNYYAHQPKPQPPDVRYAIAPRDSAPPAGMSLLARGEGSALFVRDYATLARDRQIRLPSPAGSPAYFIPRGMIFHSIPYDRPGPRIIQVVDLIERWGFPVEPVLRYFNVKR